MRYYGGIAICFLVALILYYQIWCVTAQPRLQTQQDSRTPLHTASALGNGLIFSPNRKQLLIEAGHWLHVFQIEIPTLDDVLPVGDNPFQHSILYKNKDSEELFYMDAVRVNEYISMLNDRIRAEYEVFYTRMALLFPNNNTVTTRYKRSLLDASGLFKSLFNIPSSADMANMKSLVKVGTDKNSAMINKLRLNTNKLISHLKVTDDMIGELSVIANDIVHKYNNLSRELTSNRAMMARTSARSFLMAQYTLAISQAELIMNNMRQRLDSLIRHQISSNLITPDTIIEVFSTIISHLQQRNTKYTIDTDLTHFYENKNFKVQRHDNTIYIFVQFSMIYAEPDEYELYTLRQNPLPLTSYQKSNKAQHWASQVSLEDEALLVVLPKRSAYAILTHRQLNLCQVTQTRIICDFPVVMKDYTFPTCIFGIFQNKPEIIKDMCQFEFLMSNIEPDITYLSDNKILASNVSLLKIECADRTYSRTLSENNSTIIEITGCACIIKDTQNGQMLPAFMECSIGDPTPTQIINNNILPQLMTQKQIRLQGQKLLNQGQINIPPIQQLPVNDILKTTEKQKYNLNKLLKQMQSSDTLYTSKADKAMHRLLSLSDQTWLSQAANPINITIFILIAIALAALGFRMYKMGIILTALMNKKAFAAELPDYIYEDSTEDPNTIYDHAIIVKDHANNNTTLFIMFIILCIALHKFFKWLRTSNSKYNCNWNRVAATQVYASIGNANKNIIIKWQTFNILSHRLKMPETLGSIKFSVHTLIPLIIHRIELQATPHPHLLLDQTTLLDLNMSAYITMGIACSIKRLKRPRSISFLYVETGNFKPIPFNKPKTLHHPLYRPVEFPTTEDIPRLGTSSLHTDSLPLSIPPLPQSLTPPLTRKNKDKKLKAPRKPPRATFYDPSRQPNKYSDSPNSDPGSDLLKAFPYAVPLEYDRE